MSKLKEVVVRKIRIVVKSTLFFTSCKQLLDEKTFEGKN